MVSFTDHHNAISIGRLPSKAKVGKDSWYFNNSLLWKPEFSSTTKNLPIFQIAQKTTTLQQVTGGITPNLVLQRMQGHFLKIRPLRN